MTIKHSKFILFFLLIIGIEGCQKPEVVIQNQAEFESWIAEEMEDQHIPALSVLTFQQDAILYEGLFGPNNLNTQQPLGPDDLFLLASVSKTITATALMQLYEQDSFELEDPINDYLPFEVHHPDYSSPITFRMLLTHTSGIADGPALDEQYYYNQDPTVALADFMENYLVPGGDFYDANQNFYGFEPGTDHEYSNEGSALIAVLVESITGMGFNDYCKQHIFTPLGMENTFWRLDEINQTIVQPCTYSRREFQALDHYTFTDYPNGGLRSTSRDLFHFFSAFTNGGSSMNHPLLQPASVELMLTPQITSLEPEMGLHFFIMDSDKGLWGHDGGEQGVSTLVAFHPDDQKGTIVLANREDLDLEQILSFAYQLE